jgi:hypothetical protein
MFYGTQDLRHALEVRSQAQTSFEAGKLRFMSASSDQCPLSGGDMSHRMTAMAQSRRIPKPIHNPIFCASAAHIKSRAT